MNECSTDSMRQVRSRHFTVRRFERPGSDTILKIWSCPISSSPTKKSYILLILGLGSHKECIGLTQRGLSCRAKWMHGICATPLEWRCRICTLTKAATSRRWKVYHRWFGGSYWNAVGMTRNQGHESKIFVVNIVPFCEKYRVNNKTEIKSSVNLNATTTTTNHYAFRKSTQILLELCQNSPFTRIIGYALNFQSYDGTAPLKIQRLTLISQPTCAFNVPRQKCTPSAILLESVSPTETRELAMHPDRSL